ncbi:MAG TPA: hypothetical protein VI864_07710 [Candidatus Bathyarchaeia archaeon]|nr:hypothetical protein [Candidatus Bathyarchaeia archaeon]
MQIIADIYPTSPHAKIIGSLKCSQFSDLRTLEFVVDSGATFTTLLPYHVLSLGIDCSDLSRTTRPCYSANGDPMYPYELPKVELHLDKNDGKTNGVEIFVLPLIHCMPPPPRDPQQEPQQFRITNSLLGMDVLKIFKNWIWDFENGQLHLNL